MLVILRLTSDKNLCAILNCPLRKKSITVSVSYLTLYHMISFFFSLLRGNSSITWINLRMSFHFASTKSYYKFFSAYHNYYLHTYMIHESWYVYPVFFFIHISVVCIDCHVHLQLYCAHNIILPDTFKFIQITLRCILVVSRKHQIWDIGRRSPIIMK